MDTLQTTLIKDADAIWTRIMRLVEDLASGSFSALMKEVRAFEARVRLWLFALALELPAAPSMSRRPSAHRRPGKPGPVVRKRRPRLGLRLFPNTQTERGPNTDADAPKLRAKRDDNDRFLDVIALFNRFDDLRSTLMDPSAALAKIMRGRRIKSAPEGYTARAEERAESFDNPYTDDMPAEKTGAQNLARPPNLPRPDS